MPGGSNTADDNGVEADARVGRIVDEYVELSARGESSEAAALLERHPDAADEARAARSLHRLLGADGGDHDDPIDWSFLTPSQHPTSLGRLDGYEVTGLIGRGGMGLVLEAWEATLDRTVALKVLYPHLAANASAMERFRREARAAATTRHPNIVTVHAAGRCAGVAYLSMERIDGPSLHDLLRERGALPTELVRRLGRQLLTGLASAHAAGLIHRDIKSANLLLDGVSKEATDQEIAERGTLKIADFGLARVLSACSRITRAGAVFGTPEFMSPEQAGGEADTDARTDVYSAGVVLYEMLTGRVPFRASTSPAVIYQIIHRLPTDPSEFVLGVDRDLANLALWMLSKRPEERPSATEALDRLEVGGLSRPPFRRRRPVSVSLLVLALSVAVSWIAAGDLMGSHRALIDVRPTPGLTNSLQARWQVGGAYEPFFDAFPDGVDAIFCSAALDLDGDGDKDLVVAGAGQPVSRGDSAGATLFAIGLEGELAWSMSLTPDRHDEWPDVDAFRYWRCRALAAGDLDGEPGDELVVAARELLFYPTRVSVLDVREDGAEIRGTFWHMGDVGEVEIVPDLIQGELPGIAGLGINNKLDGFDEPGPCQDEVGIASFDMVPVVFFLDPRSMDGLGPPWTRCIEGLDPMRPHGYGYLNLSASAGDGAGVSEVQFRKLVCEAGPNAPRSFRVGVCVAGEGVGDIRLGYDLGFLGPVLSIPWLEDVFRSSWNVLER